MPGLTRQLTIEASFTTDASDHANKTGNWPVKDNRPAVTAQLRATEIADKNLGNTSKAEAWQRQHA